MSVAPAPAAPAECSGHELVDPHDLAFPESVALAVILQTLRDLQSDSVHQRHDAQLAVTVGAMDVWVDLLNLPDAAAARVVALLQSMACA